MPIKQKEGAHLSPICTFLEQLEKDTTREQIIETVKKMQTGIENFKEEIKKASEIICNIIWKYMDSDDIDNKKEKLQKDTDPCLAFLKQALVTHIEIGKIIELKGSEETLRQISHLIQSVEILSGKYGIEGQQWQEKIKTRGFELVTAEESVKKIESGDYIYANLHSTGAIGFVKAVKDRIVTEVDSDPITATTDVRIGHVSPIGEKMSCKLCELDRNKYGKHIRENAFFISRSCPKKPVTDYTILTFYELMGLFETGNTEVNVAVIQIPPPVNGKINFGPDPGINISLIKGLSKKGGKIIFEVNPALPYVPGKEMDLNFLENSDAKIYFFEGAGNLDMMYNFQKDRNKDRQKIAKNVASLVKNGDTVQLGIGNVPNMVMEYLREIGIDVDVFSEILADGGLIYFDKNTPKGKANIEKFTKEGRKMIAGFMIGSKELMEFMRKYPQLFYLDSTIEVNNPENIANRPNLKAINAATEITPLGEVAAFTINGKLISGPGGQKDFKDGAILSYMRQIKEEGSSGSASIIALKSHFIKDVFYDYKNNIPSDKYAVPPGEKTSGLYHRLDDKPEEVREGKNTGKFKVKVMVSRISPDLGPEATLQGIGDVRYFITENGVTGDLKPLSMGQRAKEIINLANPIFREKLTEVIKTKSWMQ